MFLKVWSAGALAIPLSIAIGTAGAIAAPAGAESPEAAEKSAAQAGVSWEVAARDVYVDGRLRPDVRVLLAPGLLAVAIPEDDSLLVVEERADEEEGVGSTLSLLSLAAAELAFEGPLKASSPRPTESLGGAVATPAGGLLIHGPRHVLLTSRQGPVGAVDTADDLWELVPVWRQLYDAYRPDAESVEALRSYGRPVRLTVSFGTWCGDSRRSVPRLLKALDLANNPNLELELVGIERGFTAPLDFVRRHRVTNVPTVVAAAPAAQGGGEIGRFVENPRSEVIEKDLAAILAGRPEAERRLYRPADLPVAGATLGLYRGERRVGEERWRIFATEDGGSRLWVRQRSAAGVTETWQSFDADGAATYVQVTRTSDGEHSRTRLWREGPEAVSTTRGDATGIVRQTVSLPSRSVILAPGAAGLARAWLQAGRAGEALSVPAHAVAAAGDAAPGRVVQLEMAGLAPRRLDLRAEGLAGALEAPGLEIVLGNRSGRYWLHPELDLPILAELDDGGSLRLEILELEASGPQT
ncbi:MAG: thioredoxin family protein [Acidobacteriota bacterium]